MRIKTTPHPQPTQRRIFSQGNTGRQLIDQQQAATYIASQKTSGKAKNADVNSIAFTLEALMLMVALRGHEQSIALVETAIAQNLRNPPNPKILRKRMPTRVDSDYHYEIPKPMVKWDS